MILTLLIVYRVTISSRAMMIEQKKLLFHRVYEHMESAVVEYYDDILEALSRAVEILHIHATLRPFKILGMEAQVALVISIITTTITFYGTLATMYTTDTDALSSVGASPTV
jgi:hypothetical protein